MEEDLSSYLTTEDAYLRIHHSKPQVSWGKRSWSKLILPSKHSSYGDRYI